MSLLRMLYLVRWARRNDPALAVILIFVFGPFFTFAEIQRELRRLIRTRVAYVLVAMDASATAAKE